MIDLGFLWDYLKTLVGVALRSFALTLAGMVALGLVLAGVSYYLASEASVARGVLAALAAMLICAILGFIVAGQRAVAVALMRGLTEKRLGDATFGLILERLLGMPGEGAVGERGGKVAQALERVPLAQAEARLREAVDGLLSAPQKGGGLGGWLRRKLQTRLLGTVHEITLARLRQEGAEHGGVDLLKLRRRLGDSIDGLVISRIRGYAVRGTALTVAVAVGACLALALLLQRVGV